MTRRKTGPSCRSRTKLDRWKPPSPPLSSFSRERNHSGLFPHRVGFFVPPLPGTRQTREGRALSPTHDTEARSSPLSFSRMNVAEMPFFVAHRLDSSPGSRWPGRSFSGARNVPLLFFFFPPQRRSRPTIRPADPPFSFGTRVDRDYLSFGILPPSVRVRGQLSVSSDFCPFFPRRPAGYLEHSCPRSVFRTSLPSFPPRS